MGHCSSKWQGATKQQYHWTGITVIWVPVSTSLSEAVMIKKEQQNLKPHLGPLFPWQKKKVLASKRLLAYSFGLTDSWIPCCSWWMKTALLTTRWLSSALVGLHTSQACKPLCHWPENRLFYSASIWWFWNMAILTVNLLEVTRKCLERLQSSGTLACNSQRSPGRE